MIQPLRLDVERLEIGSPAIVDAALVKKHVRVDHSDDDTLLDVFLRASVLWCEAVTHRTLFRRSHTWVLQDFERCEGQAMRLPRGKTLSIEGVSYSAGGVTQTLYGASSDASPEGEDFQEDLRSDSGGVIMPNRGSVWPSVDCDVVAPVEIAFTAGWVPGELPDDLLHAVLFGIADAYDLRGTADFDPAMLGGSGPRLATRMALASSYCLPRIY